METIIDARRLQPGDIFLHRDYPDDRWNIFTGWWRNENGDIKHNAPYPVCSISGKSGLPSCHHIAPVLLLIPTDPVIVTLLSLKRSDLALERARTLLAQQPSLPQG